MNYYNNIKDALNVNGLLIVDAKVAQIYGLKNTITIKATETNKNLTTVKKLYTQLNERNINRNDVIVAVGGGIIGDTVGYTASTYKRGVNLVHVPTTLLAQIDSAIGGKTGVNTDFGKNMIGTFYNAIDTRICTEFLNTLPKSEIKTGLGEVMKYYLLGAVIPDFNNPKTYVKNCANYKLKIVNQDPLEKNIRKFLNLGHTFAHAIERYYNYKRYNHGQAVTIGCNLALKISGIKTDYEAICNELGLPTNIDIDIKELVKFMSNDKKNVSDKITLVLLKKIGEPYLQEFTPKQICQNL